MDRQRPRRRPGRGAHELLRQLAQPRQAGEPLGVLAIGGEQLPAAHAQALDQAPHEQVGAHRVEPPGRPAVQFQEAPDPLARLRRQLGGLHRARQRRHHLQALAANDLDHPRQVDLAQLDRGPRQRAHRRRGVSRVHEQTHPREHVAHLRSLQQLRTRRGALPTVLPRQALERAGRALRPSTRAASAGPSSQGTSCGSSSEEGTPQQDMDVGPGPGYPPSVDAIDWSTAQRVGELIAGSPAAESATAPTLGDTVQPLALRFARRVGEYSGLELPEELPPLEAVDRPGWIAANLKTMRPVLESLAAEGLGPGGRSHRPHALQLETPGTGPRAAV